MSEIANSFLFRINDNDEIIACFDRATTWIEKPSELPDGDQWLSEADYNAYCIVLADTNWNSIWNECMLRPTARNGNPRYKYVNSAITTTDDYADIYYDDTVYSMDANGVLTEI